MPTIVFAASEWGPSVSAERPEGGPLVDVCDEAHAPVAFSCRSASCGTCRVEVIAGADLLLPASREERDVLEIFAAPASHRLACQAVVREGPGLVSLRQVGEEE